MPNSEKSVVPNQVKETLYSQLLKAIEKYSFTSSDALRNSDCEAAAKACQSISEEWAKGQREEWAKGFAEWIEENRWTLNRDMRFPESFARWYNTIHPNVTITESKSTDELIQLYKSQTEK